MKFKSFKIHGVKTHTPTFHIGSRKYKPGYWAQLKTSRRGNIGFSWRVGWREHDHSKPAGTARVDRRLSSIFKPVASAGGIGGHNPLQSNYG